MKNKENFIGLIKFISEKYPDDLDLIKRIINPDRAVVIKEKTHEEQYPYPEIIKNLQEEQARKLIDFDKIAGEQKYGTGYEKIYGCLLESKHKRTAIELINYLKPREERFDFILSSKHYVQARPDLNRNDLNFQLEIIEAAKPEKTKNQVLVLDPGECFLVRTFIVALSTGREDYVDYFLKTKEELFKKCIIDGYRFPGVARVLPMEKIIAEIFKNGHLEIIKKYQIKPEKSHLSHLINGIVNNLSKECFKEFHDCEISDSKVIGKILKNQIATYKELTSEEFNLDQKILAKAWQRVMTMPVKANKLIAFIETIYSLIYGEYKDFLNKDETKLTLKIAKERGKLKDINEEEVNYINDFDFNKIDATKIIKQKNYLKLKERQLEEIIISATVKNNGLSTANKI